MSTNRPPATINGHGRSLLLLASGLAAAAAVAAQPAAPAMQHALTPVFPTAPCGGVDIAPVIQVSVGKSTVIRPAVPIRRVLLGNPENSNAAAPRTPTDKTPAGAAMVPVSADTRRSSAPPFNICAVAAGASEPCPS